MHDFETFLQQSPKLYPHLTIKNDRDEVYMTLSNKAATKVAQFLWLQKIFGTTGTEKWFLVSYSS